ncbi:MAG: STAS/SEC14 domain-containing protein [Myxococcota bacterium]
MTLPHIDESHWPLVRVSWSGQVTIEEIDEHFAAMEAIARRDQLFGVVVNMRDVGWQSTTQRQRGVEQLRRVAVAGRDNVVGVAHVVRGPLARAMLTAVYWASQPAFPIKVFAELEPACAWACELLVRRGAPHPPDCDL